MSNRNGNEHVKANGPRIDAEKIPADLRALPQWVTWVLVPQRNDKPRKLPKQINGKDAAVNAPDTFTTFDKVLARCNRGGVAGPGYVFQECDPYCGIDLDGCRNPETGEIADWAKEILQTLDSYSEVSPSGTGVKVFVRGKSPMPKGKKKTLPDLPKVCDKEPAVEVYDHKRYFAVTSQRLAELSPNIEPRQEQVDAICKRFWPPRDSPLAKPPARASSGESSVIERARKYLEKVPGAVSGQGGHDATYAAACALVLGFDLTPEQAYPLLVEWNEKCQPSWSEADLHHKLNDANAEPGERGYLRDKPNPKAKPRARRAGNAKSEPETVTPSSGRPTIVVNHEIARMVDEGVAALRQLPNVYQRAGSLSRVVEGGANPPGIDRPEDAPRIIDIGRETLDELLPLAAEWVKLGADDKHVRASVPDKVTKALAARGYWDGIPKITAVVETPIVRSDGSVLQDFGYDAKTGIVFWRQGEFPRVPERPSIDDAITAVDKLLAVVGDFPFASEAHRSAWLASVLTPFSRFSYYGPAPLMLADANTRGVGKGLLQAVTTTIISGRGIACMSLPHDDVEFSKTITSVAIAGLTSVLIDNISGVLGSAAFDAALTATSWTGRVLGQSKMTVSLPLLVTWYGTGNNVAIGADTSRRVLHIRLETPLEKPEERTDFRHRDLLGYVTAHRGELAIACCTILKAYFDAGLPDQGLREWGSYEKWSRLVRGAIVWAGQADPGETRVELAERSDLEANALKGLLAAWEQLDPGNEGLTAAHALRLLDDFPDKYTMAREVFIEQFAHGKAKAASTRAIGKRLSSFRRRVIGGRMFDCKPDRNGIQEWLVVTDSAGFAGYCGVSPNPPRARTHAHAHTRTRTRDRSKQTPPNPSNPATPETTGECPHEPHERLTHDKYIRTECRVCGEVLKPDRKAEAVGA